MTRAHPALALAVAMLLFASAAPGAQETGDLPALRQEALDAVNAARREHGLEPLQLTQTLNEAAQAHAVDMVENDYYAHVSPEGVTPRDRFLDHGGSEAKLTAENIARCTGCPSPPTSERVRSFQQGWMESPEHRQNILTEGLAGFGFGIAAEDGEVYAVQTFAGPGTPRGLEPGEEPVVLEADALDDEAVAVLNRVREREGLPPVEASEGLTQAARGLLPETISGDRLIRQTDNLFGLLPEGKAAQWSGLQVVAAGCGGCGTQPTAQDVRAFVTQWLDNPQYRPQLMAGNAGGIGFAMQANGEGRKVAIAVVGER